MSLDNANGYSSEGRVGASSPEHVGEELGWLNTAGSTAADNQRIDEPSAAVDGPAGPDADAAVLYEDQVQPETGILGFTLRELLIVGAWLVAFVVSFFPLSVVGGSIWTNGIGWILTIGLPTVAVFLIVLRRFSPDGIRRVGSLGIDQFASVAASVAAVAWAQLLWSQIAATISTGLYVVGWVVIVAQLATLALVATTAAAPLIPRLRDDFEGRMETLAHRSANPVRPVVPRPRPQRVAPPAVSPAEDATATETADAAAADAAEHPESIDAPVVVSEVAPMELQPVEMTPVEMAPVEQQPAEIQPVEPPAPEKDHYTDPVGVLQEIFASDDDATTQLPVVGAAQASAESADVSTDPFWILAMTERDVYDEHGQPLFRIGPTAWTLVIEDRGGAYVVRHEDGRIGYLHDLTDITKG